METLSIIQESVKTNEDLKSRAAQYHSVEVSIHGLDYLYQFKIRNISSESMNVIVRENSGILNELEVGKRFTMKYYTDDFARSTDSLDTEIIHITRADEGRFKGHYIVGLSIVKGRDETITH